MKSLEPIFSPGNVAVIGAIDVVGNIGRRILWNLISNPFGGTVFPVNPSQSSVLGIKAYPNIEAVPEPIDMAIVRSPAPEVPDIIHACSKAHVKGVIIASDGLEEPASERKEWEQKIISEAHRGRMRILGPNCLGVMNPYTGLNASYARTIARPGNVGFISQSAALCTAILDWSLSENVGFSAFISTGAMIDVDWGDLIYHLSDEPHTRSILIYMETINNARSFLSAAREVALSKPIIVIKAGVVQRTGSIAIETEDEAVLDAAFRRCGILRVESLEDLFYMAEVLQKQPRPRGPRLTIMTNASGPGLQATDALITNGGRLTDLSPDTIKAFDKILSPGWGRQNPVNISGEAIPQCFAASLEIALRDPHCDGVLVILTPQANSEPTRTAEEIRALANSEPKPVLASWMGGIEVSAGRAILSRAGIPTFPFPDVAARLFNYMWRYTYNLRGLYETPALCTEIELSRTVRQEVEDMLSSIRRSGRPILNPLESRKILGAYQIPMAEFHIATREKEAVKLAEKIGYPVVIKPLFEHPNWESGVDGTFSNLQNATAVIDAYRAIVKLLEKKANATPPMKVIIQPMMKREEYEINLRSNLDPRFGPVLVFGAGGKTAEIYQDRALALPPLTSTLARRMMEQTKIYNALKSKHEQRAIDLPALEQLIVRFSQLVVEQQWIKQIEIHPLLYSERGWIALNARMILHPLDIREDQLPRPAIRPYPTQYISHWNFRENVRVTIRPIRPEDEPMMVQFHENLSDQSVYFRYFHPVSLRQRISHERLARICFIDYDREMVLVVEQKEKGRTRIIAVGRLNKIYGTNEAEFAIVISDPYQYSGLGTELLSRLVQIGRCEKLQRIVADILPENTAMQRVCEKVGFKLHFNRDEQVVKASISLE